MFLKVVGDGGHMSGLSVSNVNIRKGRQWYDEAVKSVNGQI